MPFRRHCIAIDDFGFRHYAIIARIAIFTCYFSPFFPPLLI